MAGFTYNAQITVPLVTEKSRAREKAAEARKRAERQAAADTPQLCYKPQWTTRSSQVNGDKVEVLQIPGLDIVAVPVGGWRNSAKFDMIDLAKMEFLCQLTKKEDEPWMAINARTRNVPPNSTT